MSPLAESLESTELARDRRRGDDFCSARPCRAAACSASRAHHPNQADHRRDGGPVEAHGGLGRGRVGAAEAAAASLASAARSHALASSSARCGQLAGRARARRHCGAKEARVDRDRVVLAAARARERAVGRRRARGARARRAPSTSRTAGSRSRTRARSKATALYHGSASLVSPPVHDLTTHWPVHAPAPSSGTQREARRAGRHGREECDSRDAAAHGGARLGGRRAADVHDRAVADLARVGLPRRARARIGGSPAAPAAGSERRVLQHARSAPLSPLERRTRPSPLPCRMFSRASRPWLRRPSRASSHSTGRRLDKAQTQPTGDGRVLHRIGSARQPLLPSRPKQRTTVGRHARATARASSARRLRPRRPRDETPRRRPPPRLACRASSNDSRPPKPRASSSTRSIVAQPPAPKPTPRAGATSATSATSARAATRPRSRPARDVSRSRRPSTEALPVAN